MGNAQGPFAGWAKRDRIAFWVCIGLGVSVAEAVGEAVRPSLAFRPAFAVKVAAGDVAVIVAWVIWVRLFRPRLVAPPNQPQ